VQFADRLPDATGATQGDGAIAAASRDGGLPGLLGEGVVNEGVQLTPLWMIDKRGCEHAED
jgi:hypothetical protein